MRPTRRQRRTRCGRLRRLHSDLGRSCAAFRSRAVIVWRAAWVVRRLRNCKPLEYLRAVTMSDQDRAGTRIATIRKMRGWTGRELANKTHVSYSLLAKVESGAVPASPALIGAVARALRVDVPRITGQPYEERQGGHQATLNAMI